MASSTSSSGEDLIKQISGIARNAIEEINRLINSPVTGNSNSVDAISRTARNTHEQSESEGNHHGQTQTSRPNLLQEMRRRFPTLSSRDRLSAARPSASIGTRAGGVRSVGRPCNSSELRDIVIVGYDVDKTPLGRNARLDLEERGRVVTAFNVEKTWNRVQLYDKVKQQFPEDCQNVEFEFVKNVAGTLVKPNLATGVEINSKILLKSIATAGTIYVRLHADDDFDDDLLHASLNQRLNSVDIFPNVNTANSFSEPREVDREAKEPDSNVDPTDLPDVEEDEDKDMKKICQEVIQACQQSGLQNPVDILKVAQQKIVVGRDLELTDPSVEISGETSFIVVDRDDLFTSGLGEINNISNFRLPLEVNFSGEVARDYGGPRKEFFRLMMISIKETLFDGGLRQDLKEKYAPAGLLMGLSVLQNGKIPKFIPEEMVQELAHGSPASSPCLKNLQKGLQKSGVLQLMKELPQFLHLFRPSTAAVLNFRKLTHLLAPKFAEEGTNRRKLQKDVYNAFIRYTREVAAGRRGTGAVTITLGHMLQFVCGTDEEPILGFAKSPEIQFVEVFESFLPTANTCVNVLNLPHATVTNSLPPDDVLFHLYDYSFSNSYFGHA